MPLPKASSLVSNSFFIFITRAFPSLATLLVVIWYSKRLPVAQYGEYQRFWIHLSIIYPIACFGIHVLIVTYPKSAILRLLKKVKLAHYGVYAFWVGALSTVFALLQNAIGVPFYISFLFLALYAGTFILESFLMVCKAYSDLVLVNVLYSVMFCCIHWLAWQSLPLSMLFTLLTMLAALRFVFYFVRSRREIRSAVVTEPVNTDLSKVRPLWLHLAFYDISQVFFNYIDKFIISIVLTAGMSAIYYNGAQTIPFLPLLLAATGSAVLMQLASGEGKSEQADTVRLMNQSGKLLSCVAFPVFFFLLFFRVELIGVLFSDKYLASIPIFLVAIMVIPVKAYSFTTVLQRAHKGNIINIGAIADLVLACAFMYPLYLWIGLPGVALSFVISTYLQAAFYLIYSARLMRVTPLKMIPYVNWLIKLIVFASLFIAIHYATDQFFSRKIALVLGMVTLLIVTCASLYLELKNQKKDVSIQ